jgi:hypothetical protein
MPSTIDRLARAQANILKAQECLRRAALDLSLEVPPNVKPSDVKAGPEWAQIAAQAETCGRQLDMVKTRTADGLRAVAKQSRTCDCAVGLDIHGGVLTIMALDYWENGERFHTQGVNQVRKARGIPEHVADSLFTDQYMSAADRRDAIDPYLS